MTAQKKEMEGESIKIFDLPSLLLSQKSILPACPSIYFVLAERSVLYIGRASNLLSRWKKHHRYAELQQLDNLRIAWMEVSDSQMLPAIETALIKQFKPKLNRTGIKIRTREKGPGRGRPGGNPSVMAKPLYEEAMAGTPLSVRVSVSVDAYVRSLPNRTEWLRQTIEAQAERDLLRMDTQASTSDDNNTCKLES